MSSRALRKLHGRTEIVVPGLSMEEEDDDREHDSPSGHSIPVPNKFDLLNDSDNSNEEEETRTVESEEQTKNAEVGGSVGQQDTQSFKQQNRKKKKKKKKENKAVNNERKHTYEEDNEVAASIREVNAILGDLPTDTSDRLAPSLTDRTLLAVEHRYLNPENEMKKLFGSRVVQAERGSRRQRHRMLHRSTWMAQPRDTWPPAAKLGLSMVLLETKHGCQYFAFQHNAQYQKIQIQFWEAVESLNPENIVQLLNVHPYHIDCLLQLSEVCRMSEDYQMASELIERALYSFECNFHPVFSLTQGTCRLDYRRPENRAFYLAIFRHLLSVGLKGCYRTALEFCKLLLSFDPDGDPLCVLLMIDFYALRSEQYGFICRMYMEWEAHRNLSQLPNFAFSAALCSLLEARQNQTDEKTADSMLQEALLMFPGVLMLLLDKCSVCPDPQVAGHPFFNTSTLSGEPEALRQLIALYVGRCHSCWKPPEIINWLEKNVKVVLEKVDGGDTRVQQFQTSRRARYKGTPRNVLRHVLMSEIKDATATLPPDLANSPFLSCDPLPPSDSIVSYTRPQRTRQVQQDSSPLSMFFRSLLPNFNPQEIVEDDDGAAGGNPTDLRQGVHTLMAAMRDLLSNIQMTPPPVEGQDNQEEQQEWD